MNELQTIKADLEAAILQITAYEVKNTKAESARIRKILGAIKNQITSVRAALVAMDRV